MLMSIKTWLFDKPNTDCLAQYAKTGDNRYLNQLVAQYGNDLYHYLVTQSDKDLALDICQQIWLKVIDKRDFYNDQNNPRCAVHGDAFLRQPPDGEAPAQPGLLRRAQAHPAADGEDGPARCLPAAAHDCAPPGAPQASLAIVLEPMAQKARLFRDLVIERPNQIWCADITRSN